MLGIVCGNLSHQFAAPLLCCKWGIGFNVFCSKSDGLIQDFDKRKVGENLSAEKLRTKFEGLGIEEWRRKRIGWLCKEIPVLKIGGITKILKKQKQWIRRQEMNYIVLHLLRCGHLMQAHQVYKWWERQSKYEPDLEIINILARILAMQGKVGRAQDLYDSLINSGHVPDMFIFSALITGYLLEGVDQSFEKAWVIYLQMKHLGGYEPPRHLKLRIFKALMKGCFKSLKWLDYADTLFESFSEPGLSCDCKMYTSLMHFHALRGDEAKVEALFKQSQVAGFQVSPEMFTSFLIMCSKTGNFRKAEHMVQELKKIVQVPHWRNYVYLIRTYAKAGLNDRTLQVFHEIKGLSSELNFNVYVATIEAIAGSENLQLAQKVLDELCERDCQSSQSAFNSVMQMYIRKGLHHQVETVFSKMKLTNCRPNHESYNLLIFSYLHIGILAKAEEVYSKMCGNSSISRNLRTYMLMLEGYGKAGRHVKVLEVAKEVALRKMVLQSSLRHFVLAAQEKCPLGNN